MTTLKSNRFFRFMTGRFLAHLVLLFIVALWTAPTLGLLVSSFRDKEQLIASGWWSSFRSSVQTTRGRLGGASAMVKKDGVYIIKGNLFAPDDKKEILQFGKSVNNPVEFEAGQSITYPDGSQVTIESNGRYTWSSNTPYPGKRGKRVYYSMTVPPKFTLDNYKEVMATQGIWQSFINTFTVTIPATIIPIMLAAFAAYAFAWMRFPGRQVLFVVVVGLLVVPLQMSLIPVLRMYNSIGAFFDASSKTYLGIWLAHTGFGLPLAIYLLRNYMSSLPADIIESAKIEGATHFQIFTKIVMPLSVPALASFAIFQFLWVWNDLLVALVFLGKQDNQIVLTSKLRELLGSHGGNWEILTTSAFISIVVPLAVFIMLQRYFIRGLVAGSVKE